MNLSSTAFSAAPRAVTRIRASYSGDRPPNQPMNYPNQQNYQQQPQQQQQRQMNYPNQPQNQQAAYGQQNQQQPHRASMNTRAGPMTRAPVNSRGRPMPRSEPPPKVRTWDEDDMRNMFNDWAKRHEKHYATPEEREYRYGCFKDMFLKVNQHHPERQETLDRLNNYADFTVDELYDFICKRD